MPPGPVARTTRVSVITPAYNAAESLRACVESLSVQSYRDFEQIVVDDGSSDATYELARSLAAVEPRLSVLRQERKRQAAARNLALRHARGEYIALLDADDVALPGRLERQVGFLDRHPEIDVLGGGLVNVDAAGAVLSEEQPPEDHEALARAIFRCSPFCTSTVMARRRFFETLSGFAPELPPAEDYDLWLRGYRSFRYHNLREPLVRYRSRRHAFSKTRAATRVLWRAVLRERRIADGPWLVLRPLVWHLARRAGFAASSWEKEAPSSKPPAA